MDRVLVVDDEEAICDDIRSFLVKAGYQAFAAQNGKDAIRMVDHFKPGVVLMNVRMPVMDGLEVLSKIKQLFPAVGVIMVTTVNDINIATECMKAGAIAHVLKPINFDVLSVEIQRAFHHRQSVDANRSKIAKLENDIEERNGLIRRFKGEMDTNYFQMVNLFVDFMGVYDPFASGHAKRVAVLSVRTAQAMGLSGKECEDIEVASLLHDLGRIGMPDKLQNEPMFKLDEDELETVHQQTVVAQKALRPISRFKEAGIIIRSHLERSDGAGFPDKLSGNEIPLLSRILSVANAFDEIVKRRRFEDMSQGKQREKDDDQVALQILIDGAGKQFDKNVDEIFVSTVRNMKLVKKNAKAIKLIQLKPEMILAEDIVAENGRLLLAEGNKLSLSQITKLWSLYKSPSPVTKTISVYQQT